MSNEVGKTIYRQLMEMDKMAVFAWGSKNFVNMGDGLKFQSSGMVKWKGHIYIQYDEGMDLYNVTFAKIRKAEWKVQKKIEGVYVDMLIDVIDEQVG